MPLAHDQHDNAARIERLRAGLQSKPRTREAAEKLDRMSGSKEICSGANRCKALARESPANAARLARWAEELASG